MNDQVAHIILEEVVAGLWNGPAPSDELNITEDLAIPDANRFEVAVTVLEHFVRCWGRTNCASASCERLKVFFQHVFTCRKREECATLKRILTLVTHHALRCTDAAKCPVLYCEHATEWIRHQRIVERRNFLLRNRELLVRTVQRMYDSANSRRKG